MATGLKWITTNFCHCLRFECLLLPTESTAVFLHLKGFNLEEDSIFFPEVIVSQKTFFYQFCILVLIRMKVSMAIKIKVQG